MNNLIMHKGGNTMHTVYAKIDEHGGILEIGSDVFLSPQDIEQGIEKGDMLVIGVGVGDRYVHAQGNYLPGRTLDDDGNPRYAVAVDDNGARHIVKIADDDEP